MGFEIWDFLQGMILSMFGFDSPLIVFPLAALLISVVLHAAAIVLFPRWGLLDFPHRYGLTRARLPYPTGILSIATFCIVFTLIEPFSLEIVGILSAVIILGIFCFIDDRTLLPAWQRFFLQVAIAVLLVLCGIRIDAVTNLIPFWLPAETLQLDSGWLLVFSVGFTIAWILLTINALNWFDGIPGQVSVISTLGFLTIGLLSLSDRVGQPELALVAFVLAGISFGGLLFDLPPPRVLMGDTGAMFFGLMIGILTIYSGGKVATAFLVLGVPLIDLLFVIIRRLRRGQSPLKGNATDQHLHHRLLKKGWRPWQIILLTAVTGSGFGITALFLDTAGKIIASGILLVVMIGLSWYSKPKH